MIKEIRGHSPDNWQWDLIGSPRVKTFTPVCYHTGRCQFMSMLDRGCTIRDRVEAFAENGVPPERWSDGYMDGLYTDNIIDGIDPVEWMSNPRAGITDEHNRPT
jgi:hypothetical protein